MGRRAWLSLFLLFWLLSKGNGEVDAEKTGQEVRKNCFHGSYRSRLQGTEALARRRLTQVPSDVERCAIFEGLRDVYYSAEQNRWSVGDELLGGDDADWQRLVDCAVETEATLFLAAGLRVAINATIEVYGGLEIEGEAAAATDIPTITCSGATKLLSIRGANRVVLRRLRFADCAPSNRNSAVEITDSSVTVSECQFAGNRAGRGGAITARDGSNLTLHESSFTNNTALREGGALYLDKAGTVRISNCAFRQNWVTEADTVDTVRGGAISAVGGAVYWNLRVQECVFAQNNASQSGGALSLDGKIHSRFENCSFFENSASYGGGIAVNSTSSFFNGSGFEDHTRCTVEDSLFAGNAAESGAGIAFRTGGLGRFLQCTFSENVATFGGAIHVHNETELRASHVDFINNSAAIAGGALDIESTFFVTYSNRSPLYAGPLVEFDNILCDGNRAAAGSCISVIQEARLKLLNSSLRNNVAARSDFGHGRGTIMAFRIRLAEFDNVVFENNTVDEKGGAMYIASFQDVDETFRTGTMGRAEVRIKNCSFLSNRADRGGALFIGQVVSLWIERCEFFSNRASTRGGAAVMDAARYDFNGSFNTALAQETNRGIEALNMLRQTLTEYGVERTEPLHEVIPTLTIDMREVNVLDNAADAEGGMAVLVGSMIRMHRVTFARNTARHVGGLRVFQSIAFCTECLFDSNVAKQSGGGLAIQSALATGSQQLPLAMTYLREVIFRRNRAGNYGGGALVDGTSAYFVLLRNATFEENEARAAGAISFENTALLNVTNATFRHNRSCKNSLVTAAFAACRAVEGGGALGMAFAQFSQNLAYFHDTVFVNNSAVRGGVAHAVSNVHVADGNVPRLQFDGEDLTTRFVIEDTRIEHNVAEADGGAFFFDGIPIAIQNVSMAANEAGGRGGAGCLVGGSVAKIVGGSFTGNQARDGGVFWIGGRNMMYCRSCLLEGNAAAKIGGGASVAMEPYEAQPIAFQCDDCVFRHNTAQIGGGLHTTCGNNMCSGDLADDSFVVLRGAAFAGNSARIGGGAIAALRPSTVRVVCEYQRQAEASELTDLDADYIKGRAARRMPNLAEVRSCRSWGNNTVHRGGYGQTTASYGQSALATFHAKSGVANAAQSVVLTRTKELPVLPPIYATLVDDFGQSPAEDRTPSRTLEARIRARNAEGLELSGQLAVSFDRGEAVFDTVIVRGPPGNYNIELDFLDPGIEFVQLGLEILPCPIGWMEVSGNTDCERCDTETYNLEPETGSCRNCPADSRCRFWGIEPAKGYWIPFPCYEDARACLTEEACDFGTPSSPSLRHPCCIEGREEEMETFFNSTFPSCDLSNEKWKEFRDSQCTRGYSGRLCGSCVDGYGRYALTCGKCQARGVVFCLFFCTLFWFLLVIGFSIKNNLKETRRQSTMEGVADETSAERFMENPLGGRGRRMRYLEEFAEARTSDTTVGPSERRPPPEEALMIDGSRNTAREMTPLDCEQRAEDEKKVVTETFKVFINFAQVTSMALAINVGWPDGMATVLGSLDFVGVTSTDTVVSIDCVFSRSSSIPRAIKREILMLAIPFMSVAICGAFFSRGLRTADLSTLRRRIILSVVVIFYISYIGITRRLIRILYCERVTDGASPTNLTEAHYWIEDTGVKCYTGSHLVLTLSLVIPMFLVISVAFPIYSAIVLIQSRRVGLLRSDEMRAKFGFMSRGYSDEFVFWDSIIMLRKALLALIVGLGYPLGSNLQGVLATIVLLTFMLVQTSVCPFHQDIDFLNRAEVASLTISCWTFLSGFALNDDHVDTAGRAIVSGCVILLLSGFSIYCFAVMYVHGLSFFLFDLKANKVDLRESECVGCLLKKWLIYKLSDKLCAFDRKTPSTPE